MPNPIGKLKKATRKAPKSLSSLLNKKLNNADKARLKKEA